MGLKSANTPSVPFLKWLVGSEALDFLFLAETKCNVSELEHLAISLGLGKFSGCDSNDLSEGLFLCWGSNLDVTILFVSKNYVCCSLKDECNIVFYIVLCLWGP